MHRIVSANHVISEYNVKLLTIDIRRKYTYLAKESRMYVNN